MSGEHDVFISYTHRDNRPDATSGFAGWVTEFHRRLERRLAELLPRVPHLWRDEKLSGHDLFDSVIFHELARTKLMIAVLSPPYLGSAYCKKEFSHFWEAAGGVAQGQRSRIYKVMKSPVDDVLDLLAPEDKAVRELMERVTGYEFFRRDPSGDFREFSPLYGPDSDILFQKRIDDLAKDIRRALVEAARDGLPTATPRPTVFVAWTARDMAAARDDVVRELTDHGYKVLPDSFSPPVTGPDCRDYLDSILQECKLAVHLVGEGAGFTPEGEALPLVELQYELSREKPRLAWTPPGQKPCLQDRLERDPDWCQVPMEEFLAGLHDRLKEPPPKAPEPQVQDRKVAYLVHHQNDQDHVGQVHEWLKQRDEVQVLAPPPGMDEATLQMFHEQFLTMCDGALVFQGHAPDPWIYKMLLDLQKAAGYRGQPIPVQVAYLADPVSPVKQILDWKGAEVVRSFGGVDTAPLESFVLKLQQSP